MLADFLVIQEGEDGSDGGFEVVLGKGGGRFRCRCRFGGEGAEGRAFESRVRALLRLFLDAALFRGRNVDERYGDKEEQEFHLVGGGGGICVRVGGWNGTKSGCSGRC